MTAVKLTVRFIEERLPAAKDQIFWDSEVKGLGLKVTPKGKRTFFLFYRTIDHTQRKPRIGDYPAMRPDHARRIAQELLTQVRSGGDPSAARQKRRTERGTGTISEYLPIYIKSKERGGLKTVGETKRIFEYNISPVLGGKRPEEVTSQDVTRLLDAIEARSASVAWSVRRQLSAFYSWMMPRLPQGAVNPMTNASRPAVLKSRERVLDSIELKALWAALEGEPSHWRIALRLMILTGQRREEVLGADWPEVSLSAEQWIIPSSRSKNGKAHLVPLSSSALSLLAELPSRTGPLFPSGTGASSKAAKRIRDAMPDVPHWRWHDIRRTVATGMQRLGVRLEVTEAVLNHVSGSKSGIVGIYQKHDWANEKREALRAWAEEVARIVRQ